ncbi:uncharacterized protein EDB93DRAFT_1182054 [Suillus bovinus]|uniref:uncharacterized protein n=1 Tax=Suillus bovinus TaxID=48563 RepID=UPI001B883390|nr:uncharacterized protein EDB93DRAFT_1182054 [Suillus bovinus]KAG2129646.1 hypothetical protein EDB93DRAFT_1182054 [Suillus bovinus]
MSSYQILDSSPIRIPSVHDTEVHSRPLKRSASLASLPTPPRTHHKRSRSKAVSTTSRHASEDSGSASELEDDLGGSYAARISERHSKSEDEIIGKKDAHALIGRKKRRTADVLPAHDEEEDNENSFWTGRSGGAVSHGRKKSSTAEDSEEDKSPSPALLKYRVREPVSPPPSRRAPQVQPRASSVQRSRSPPPALFLPKPPVTPPRKLFLRALPSPSNSKAKKIWPTRDSPDNPFLAGEGEASASNASGWESSDNELPVGEAPKRESTPTPAPVFEEKPTITYVFRGQKATFHNPQYHLPPEVLEASKLPIDHPDFEVAEACPPRRLFVNKLKRKPRDRSQDIPPISSLGAKRTKIEYLDASASEGEKSTASTSSRKNIVFADGTEREPVFSKLQNSDKGAERLELLQHAREERERREKNSKQRLASEDGLRAGAFIAERDNPVRRAMGPARHS